MLGKHGYHFIKVKKKQNVFQALKFWVSCFCLITGHKCYGLGIRCQFLFSIFVQLYMYACMSVCSIYRYVGICAHVTIYIYIYIYICVCVYMFVCIFVSFLSNVYVCTYKQFNHGWLVGFYGISTFVGYLMPNPFLYK